MTTSTLMAEAATHVVPVDHWDPAEDGSTPIAVDLYRDIHKGLRSELLALVETAGRLDPHHRDDRLALVQHVLATHALLESHAHHEDGVIQPNCGLETPWIFGGYWMWCPGRSWSWWRR